MFKDRFMRINILFVLFCFKTVLSEYSCKEVEKVKEAISKEFIDISSSDVAKVANKKKTIAWEFQRYLDEDELMQKIKQIHEEGTSGTALSVISMKEDVETELQQKSDKLFGTLQTYDKGEIASQEVLMLGVAGLIVGVATKNNGLAGAGVGGIVIGGSGWYYSSSKKNAVRVHITAVNKMEEKWDHTFKNCVVIPGPGQRS